MNTEEMSKQFKYGALFLCRFWVKLSDELINEIIDDIISLAWIAYLEKPMDDLFKVGKRAAQEYIRKNGDYYKHSDIVSHDLSADYTTSRKSLDDDIQNELVKAFYSQRKPSSLKKTDNNINNRYLNAAKRDVTIIDMIYQGYSNEGISLELNQSVVSIKEYRKQIRKRLKHIQSGNNNHLAAWRNAAVLPSN